MKQRHKRKQCLKIKHYKSVLTELMLLFKPYTVFHDKDENHESIEVVVDISLIRPKIKSLVHRLEYLKDKYSS